MSKVSIKGIVIGMLVTLVLDVLGGNALLFALGGASLIDLPAEGQSAALNDFIVSTPYLTGSMVIGLLTTAIGGYVAARIAKREPYLNSGLFGVLGLILALALAKGLPLWFVVTGALLTIPAALLGGRFARPAFARA